MSSRVLAGVALAVRAGNVEDVYPGLVGGHYTHTGLEADAKGMTVWMSDVQSRICP